MYKALHKALYKATHKPLRATATPDQSKQAYARSSSQRAHAKQASKVSSIQSACRNKYSGSYVASLLYGQQIVLEDVVNAYGTLTTNALNESLGYFTQVHDYYLIGLILVIFLAILYFFMCTHPYVTRVTRESRQVWKYLTC